MKNKQYHTVRTVPKSIRKIVETKIDTLTLIYIFIKVNRLASINSEIGALVQHRSKWLILSQECNTGQLLLAVSSNVTNVALIEPDNRYVDVCQNTKVSVKLKAKQKIEHCLNGS